MSLHEKFLNTEFLLNASHESIYQYIRNKNIKKIYSDYEYSEILNVDGELFNKKLYEKNHLVTNMALAQFCLDEKIVKNLYNTDSKILKVAAISNRNIEWLTEDIIKEIVKENNETQLSALLMSDERGNLLVDLYKKQGVFTDINDEQWRKCVDYSNDNPLLLENRTQNYPDMPSTTNDYILYSLWGLPKIVPVNEQWLKTLVYIFYRSVLPQNLEFKENELWQIIKRWYLPDTKSMNSFVSYTSLRRELGRLFYKTYDEQFAKLASSDDLAIRKTFYRYCSLHCSKDELEKFYKKDGGAFLEEVVHNKDLLQYSDSKNTIFDLIQIDPKGIFYLYELPDGISRDEEIATESFVMEEKISEITDKINSLDDSLREFKLKIEQIKNSLSIIFVIVIFIAVFGYFKLH